VKTHYELLGLDPAAPAEEIKRAFRREIARYHPDKVQHLGPEFQEIAASRAAELTDAYRMLMDATARRLYDEALGTAVGCDAHPPRRQGTASGTGVAVQGAVRPESAEAVRRERADHPFHQERATTGDVLRKAAIARLRDAVGRAHGWEPLIVAGFDAAYAIKPRRSLVKKGNRHVRLLARFVSHVGRAEVEEAWRLSTKPGAFDGVICIMLLGSGLSSAKELGVAVAEQRRKTRIDGPVIVPVHVRDWEALVPPNVPDVVREVVRRLRGGS
jgi:curved DNA-binding protein CbpA